ncbi:MAG: aromatic acid decarboxylase [Gammaproteobacteria bacterium]|nr:MAG: aromatic acid decarboxylase [Gammaproteobacteria bacterium]RKZ39641.1 MAG: aromatic acid decarboxylase [Gammaproteobacteria bacterium]RKZ76088.1 MAG: aromatic acid decarboxylase [Gammaproteobacteria bacterium]
MATITLAITGASGAAYGLRLLEQLLMAKQTVYLLVSAPAQIVISMETNLKLSSHPATMQTILSERYHAAPGQLHVLGREQWMAPIASGSAVPQAMVICPCSSGTLAAIANGLSRSLIERAADVILKEQRKLILVHRETPLSVIHLENMLRLAKMGALILPASPGFYHHPQSVNDIVDFIVARVLDHLAIAHHLLPPWGDKKKLSNKDVAEK